MLQTISLLDRSDIQVATQYLNLGLDIAEVAKRAALPDGMPIFLTEGQRPHPELFAYGVHMSETLAPLTQRQYAYTTIRFVNYLDEQGTPITRVTEAVLARYRRNRLSSGIGASTWATEAIVIRRLIDFMIQTDRMPRRPWIEVGQRNVLSSAVRTTTQVRHLSAQQWLAFRNIGLRGRLPDGSVDPSFRSADVERNLLGSEIAVGTGLRLAEFSSLLKSEATVPEFTIQACAKRGTARDVYMGDKAIQMAKQYIRGTRRALVHSRQDYYRRIRAELLVVTDEDFVANRVRLPDASRHVPMSSLRQATRRKLFVDHDGYLDPAALLLGQTGLMLSTNTWMKLFNTASKRVARFPDSAQTAHGVRD